MSDTAPGPGYWKASDGSWYPPDQHPDPTHRQNWAAAPPAKTPPVAGSPDPMAPQAQPATAPTGGGGLSGRIDMRWVVAGGIGLVVVILLVAVGPFGGSSTPPTVPQSDWIAALDDLCERRESLVGSSLSSDIVDAYSSKNGPAAAEIFSRYAESYQDIVSSARDVGLPEGLEAEATEWFELQQATVDAARDSAATMQAVGPSGPGGENPEFDEAVDRSAADGKGLDERLGELNDELGLGLCW